MKPLLFILALCAPLTASAQYGPRVAAQVAAYLASHPQATATPLPAATPYPAATPLPALAPTDAQVAAQVATYLALHPPAAGTNGTNGANGTNGTNATITANATSTTAGLMPATAFSLLSTAVQPAALTAETTRAQAAETALQAPARLATAGNAPTITMASAAGSGSSATITGTNLAGTITMTSGLSLLGTGGVMTLTFADGFSFPNGCAVVFSPANVNFAGIYTKLYATPVITGGRCTGVTINTALALSISTAYSGTYVIVGW